MEPDIPAGAEVVAKITYAVELGDTVVAYHPDYGMIVKKLAIETEKQRQAIFSSRNPDYAAILICNGCKVIDKVGKATISCEYPI